MTDANNCYKILNIDIPPLKGSFDDIDPGKKQFIMYENKVSTKFLNPDLVSFLSNNNIKLADFFYASNIKCNSYQSGPTYTAYSDGDFYSNGQVKLATIEWNFSDKKVPHIFLDTANSNGSFSVTDSHTIWSNCTNIIATVTPDTNPILFNCQAASIDNMTVEQTQLPLIELKQKKLSLVFIVVEPGDPNPNNFGPEQITFESISEKLKDYIVE